jgi:DNA (cytosine-5)-methyltransferase 1
MLVTRGLAVVLGDLAQMGYDAQWCCLSAAECGAPHRRDRIWILAHSRGEHGQGIFPEIIDTQIRTGPFQGPAGSCGHGAAWWATEPGMDRMADGVAYRVDRLKALGNGQVPAVVHTAALMME